MLEGGKIAFATGKSSRKTRLPENLPVLSGGHCIRVHPLMKRIVIGYR